MPKLVVMNVSRSWFNSLLSNYDSKSLKFLQNSKLVSLVRRQKAFFTNYKQYSQNIRYWKSQKSDTFMHDQSKLSILIGLISSATLKFPTKRAKNTISCSRVNLIFSACKRSKIKLMWPSPIQILWSDDTQN